MKRVACLLFAIAAFAADPEKGREVFVPCARCHNYETEERKVGPSLKNLFLRDKLSNGEPMTLRNLRDLIRDGYNRMPAYGVLISTEDFNDLVAFLARYTEKPGGKQIFERLCIACHRTGLSGVLERRGEGEVTRVIREGAEGMPAFKDSLDEAALQSLLEHLKSL